MADAESPEPWAAGPPAAAAVVALLCEESAGSSGECSDSSSDAEGVDVEPMASAAEMLWLWLAPGHVLALFFFFGFWGAADMGMRGGGEGRGG